MRVVSEPRWLVANHWSRAKVRIPIADLSRVEGGVSSVEGETCRSATGATCVFEDGQARESQLVVHTDDELAVSKPELERDVFAGGLRLNERLARGPAMRFFERFEALQRREIVHGDKSFVE